MVLAFGAVAGAGYAIYATMPERKVAKRSYPFEGLKQELGGLESTPKVSVKPRVSRAIRARTLCGPELLVRVGTDPTISSFFASCSFCQTLVWSLHHSFPPNWPSPPPLFADRLSFLDNTPSIRLFPRHSRTKSRQNLLKQRFRKKNLQRCAYFFFRQPKEYATQYCAPPVCD